MSDDPRKRIEDLFDAALDLPASDRRAFVERAPVPDEVRREVLSLLAAHDRAEGVLDRGLPEGMTDRLRDIAADVAAVGATATEAAGDGPAGSPGRPERIGAYRVVSELGRGGMGVVYLAERADGQFRQRVAIKLLHAGHDPGLHARFLAERQILASLDHPNIARLLDGGVLEDGRPYLVMEQVPGLPIDVYCDRIRLTIPERIRLFNDVARAVDHAHRNLVIHRDLKPSNILVTSKGEVKLLDFGIAKILNPGLAPDGAARTVTDHRALTPEYASPEQVRGETLTTVTDVYSLGVILYALLCGRRPYDESRSLAQMTRLITSVEPPPPSARISAEAGEPRRAGVDRLRRQLRGDLDAIVLKALRKSPRDRYASTELLAQDLERYLDGKPVRARRGTRWYRFQRTLRRHRVEATAAVLVLLSLLGGVGAATNNARRAALERDRTDLALRQSEEVTGFLLGLFEASDPAESGGDAITAHDLLRRGQARVDALSGQPGVQARMLDVLSRINTQMGRFADAEQQIERSILLDRAAGPEGDARRATRMRALADVLRRRGLYDSARVVLVRTRDIQESLFGPGDTAVIATLNQMAGLEIYRAELRESERLLREALGRAAESGTAETPASAQSLSLLGSVLTYRGLFDEAEEALRETLRRRRRVLGESPTLAGDMLRLGDLLLRELDRPWDAELLYDEARGILSRVGGSPPEREWALESQAGLRERRGDLVGAERLLHEAFELRVRTYGREHPNVGRTDANMGEFDLRNGRLDAAAEHFRRALVVERRALGDSHFLVGQDIAGLAAVARERGDLARADSLFRRALAVRVAALPPKHHHISANLIDLADVRIRMGHPEEARTMLEQAIQRLSTEMVPSHPTIARARRLLASIDGMR